jgi:PKD repeat protein
MKIHQLFTVPAVVLLFLSTISFSQVTEGEYQLKLQSGTYSTEANLRTFDKVIPVAEITNGFYYRIIQFHEIPGNLQKEGLAKKGVLLMDYLPDYAYIAAIPVHADVASFGKYGARSIIEFTPEMKISKSLTPIPEWAIRGTDKVELDVKIHSNIDLRYAGTELRRNGFEVTNTRSFGNLISVIVNQAKIHEIASLPYVYFIDAAAAPPVPDDDRARSLHRVNAIQNEYLGGRNYTGAGVTVAIADDGAIGPHIDFTGRVTQFVTGAGGTHGDMTAGIMVGAGNLNPAYKGSAPGAHINMYSITGYTHIVDAVDNFNNLSTVITSTSYSQGSGGVYTADAQAIDNQIRINPQLIHVFSAGNAGSGWSTITGGYKAAKSVIACGNLNGFDVLESSSSRGPAQDGRIKPDLCANGYQQMSTAPNNDYSPGGGTSAASPGVAAVATCLYESYKTLNGVSNPPSALIKAVMLNSAEDLGNPGPDFQHGWGRVNALRALTTIEENRYLTATVEQGDSNIHVIEVPPGVAQLRVMVYWPDYEGSPAASKALVNDLNILLTTPGGTSYEPWVLNPATPSAVAVRGTDNLNPVEQVTLDNPSAGNYSLKVKGFAVAQGPQTYYMVYEFRTDSITVTYPAGGEGFVPGLQEHIRWEAFDNTSTFLVEYTADDGATWNTIASAVNSNLRYFTWNIPNNVTDEARVRVTRNGIMGISPETFTIVGRPQNINFISVCPDSVTLAWTGVSGAAGYEISRLGAMYMDSLAYTTSTTAVVPGTNPMLDSWYSVRVIMANGNKGRRASAVYKSPGLVNCVLAYDAEVVLLNPGTGTIFDCQNISSQQISIDISNKGANPLTNIPVYYSINGGTTVAEVYTGTIQPGATFTHTFTNTLNLTLPDTLQLITWVDYPGDSNYYNDSASATIIIVSGVVVSIPWAENFESFGLCSTSSDCEAITCNLANGFLNQTNIEIDDIDWRTNSGGTPSAGTGPAVDHTTNTSSGKYLYLEATACFQKEAHLTTPCIDLTTAAVPVLSFWHHMNGSTMGSLHVDVLNNGIWTLDAMPPISGNQGNSWQQSTINLTAFAGNIINIRFRGKTGTGFESDIAIDDISILDLTAPPLAAFSANNTTTCMGQSVNLIDLSLNFPTQWLWNISPATYSYINGTSDTSQHPQILFNALDTYDITLIASNSFGSDSVTQTAYINVNSGDSIPFSEDFESFSLCSTAGSCEAVICNLSNGFINQPNYETDNIDWRVNNGGTPSTGTGPAVDHTTNTSSGKYLYLEATACFQREAHLTTPCINLSGTTIPVLYFWYHMYGTNMGSLHVDVLYNGVWISDIMPPLSGNHGNSWHQASVNLSAFTGDVITIRFRGITGSGFESDMAIDDISIIELNSSPIASFSSSNTITCIGQPINFTDLSINAPTEWQWSISPSTYTFINGTSDTSQHPQVQFNALGSYDIILIATNSLGSDTSIQLSYVGVYSGLTLPFTEDFQATAFPPANWSIVDPGGNYTWQQSTPVTGADGNPTLASYINNFLYNNSGAEDELLTPIINIPAGTNATLTFDVAYSQYSNNYSDTLRLDISVDCGSTFMPTTYFKGGSMLATVPNQTTTFTPSDANDWRKDSLILSAFSGNDVIIKFVNINGYGNNLYIDNVNIDFVTSVKNIADNNSDINVYPNPATGGFNIDIINLTGEIKLEIIDSKSRIIFNESFKNNSQILQKYLELKYDPGIYIVRVYSDKGIINKKLIMY